MLAGQLGLAACRLDVVVGVGEGVAQVPSALGAAAVEQLQEQLLLVGEVLVDGAAAEARFRGDRLQARGVEAVARNTRAAAARTCSRVSRVMRGSNRGREVELTGITISRLRDGRIVEDWSTTDGTDLLRGLGVLRTLLAAPRLPRAQRG
jgi:hypothetical protein